MGQVQGVNVADTGSNRAQTLSTAIEGRLGSSFRDPSGFVFVRDGVLYRQVSAPYESEYRAASGSGLLQRLADAGQLVPFEEDALELAPEKGAIAVLRPKRIPAISYPYEWCFSQLKDAAILTLDILETCLEQGFVIKDASAYNVQFDQGRPVFIDHLSFERYVDGEPWVAYRQFCQHFVAPLVLASYIDPRLLRLLSVHLDGIPLDLASKMLPPKSKLNVGAAVHIHMHAKATQSSGSAGVAPKSMGRTALLALVANLRSTVAKTTLGDETTPWSDYYSHTNYSTSAMDHKRQTVKDYLCSIEPRPKTCWDLGANTGEFSVVASELNIHTTAWDFDSQAVDKAYRMTREKGVRNMLPLLLDLANPSPSLGWDLQERESVIDRGPVDVVMALALVHHLAIGNNVPLPAVADFFAELGRWAIVEFVPREDSQVKRMLRGRKDVFDNYNILSFESALLRQFTIVSKTPLMDTERTLYLLERRF